MTRKEFQECYKLADELSKTGDYSVEEASQASIALMGYAYEKKICTRKQYAIVFNWQTMMLNGLRDASQVEEEFEMKKNITLID